MILPLAFYKAESRLLLVKYGHLKLIFRMLYSNKLKLHNLLIRHKHLAVINT